MTPLLNFLLVNFSGGFAIGVGTGLAWIERFHGSGMLVDEPIAAAMVLWSFAAPFATGAICTGLARMPCDDGRK